MANKNLNVLIILSIAAVISLIYGITSSPKSRPLSGSAAVQQQRGYAENPENAAPAERKSKRSNYTAWGRNPFTPGGAASKTALVLNGIMWDEKKPLAIIGSEVLGVGGKIGEYAVTEIKKDSVILNNGTGDLELRLAQ